MSDKIYTKLTEHLLFSHEKLSCGLHFKINWWFSFIVNVKCSHREPFCCSCPECFAATTYFLLYLILSAAEELYNVCNVFPTIHRP